MDFPVKNLIFQGDADADGHTIHNLDLSGLNLSKNSVGLGNVDNTSDLLKPISNLTQNALNAKQDFITPTDNVTDYFGGDKAFHALGALALQGGNTTLAELTCIGPNATGTAKISARRSDWASSFAETYLQHYGASHAGSVLGLSAANVGELTFQNSTFAVIRTNGLTPLVFGTNGLRRMRLMAGLNVGGDSDPGEGCIEAADTITADHFEGDDLTLTGGATLGDDLILSGGGANLVVGGNASVAGALTTTLGINVGQNAAIGGNLVASGVIVNFPALPTADPHVAGQLFRSTNDLKISTG